MQQNRFGRTGLTIPHITLGAGWVGGLIIRADQETRFRQLDEALASGVDWWDTAALYGRGVSEQMIGECWPPVRRRVIRGSRRSSPSIRRPATSPARSAAP